MMWRNKGYNYWTLFFYQALTGNLLLEFLRNELPVLLKDVPLATRQNMAVQYIFQLMCKNTSIRHMQTDE